jgi:hypothetical protein
VNSEKSFVSQSVCSAVVDSYGRRRGRGRCYIIWATGFATQDLVGHIDVRGHQGMVLKEKWGEHSHRLTYPSSNHLSARYIYNIKSLNGTTI